ncbi:MAG: LacI family transcriptional regulator [Arcanobacterium sp.]|nr:LacI family transcriptional regulator [Arcanobacterium sp.]
MVTLQDVATRAGVTKMTASNVLNGNKSRVSERTREKVLDAVRELGYVGSAAARALSRQRTNLVAFIYPRYPGGLISNAHDAALIGALERELQERGYLFILHSAPDMYAAASQMKSWNVAGTIMFGTFADEVESYQLINDAPIVFIDNHGESAKLSSVSVDDIYGGELVGHYVVQQGWRSIAVAGPPPGAGGVVASRYTGFVQALRDGYQSFDAPTYYETSTQFSDGKDLGMKFAHSPSSTLPDVVFCTADIIAAGLVYALTSSGIRVPDDVAVIGFDDLPIAVQSTPQLTTVHQDIGLKAQKATQMIVAHIENPDLAPQRAFIKPKLIIRESA